MNKKGWRNPTNILVLSIATLLTLFGYVSGIVSVLGKADVIHIPYMKAKSVEFSIKSIYFLYSKNLAHEIYCSFEHHLKYFI